MTDINNIKPSSLLIGNGSNAPGPTPLKSKLLVSLAIFSLIGGLFGGALFIRSKASSEDTFLYVDTLNCNQINGWAYTGQKPTGGAKLAIYFYEAPKSGGPISGTSALTNINRPDVNLARGLIGDHGYDIAVPPELPQDKEMVVEVLLVSDTDQLITFKSGRIGPCDGSISTNPDTKPDTVVPEPDKPGAPLPAPTPEPVVEAANGEDAHDDPNIICDPTSNACDFEEVLGDSVNVGETSVLGDSIQKNLVAVSTRRGIRGPDLNGYFQLMPNANYNLKYKSVGTVPDEACGTLPLISTIHLTFNKFKNRYPDRRIYSGDLNSGDPHESHRLGIDWDIYSNPNPVDGDNDRAKKANILTGGKYFLDDATAIELGKMLVDAEPPAGGISLIYYNIPSVQKAVNAYAGRTIMKSYPGHYDHFHVRLSRAYAGKEVVKPGEKKRMTCRFGTDRPPVF